MTRLFLVFLTASTLLTACGAFAAHGPASPDQKMSSKASSEKRPGAGKDQK